MPGKEELEREIESLLADRELSPQEKKVIEYLQSVWGKDHSVMGVDQAMEIVGLRQSDETRFRIGQHIKQYPELHVIIRRWGWETLVLTPDEKLIARAIINAAREQKPAPAWRKPLKRSKNEGLAALSIYCFSNCTIVL